MPIRRIAGATKAPSGPPKPVKHPIPANTTQYLVIVGSITRNIPDRQALDAYLSNLASHAGLLIYRVEEYVPPMIVARETTYRVQVQRRGREEFATLEEAEAYAQDHAAQNRRATIEIREEGQRNGWRPVRTIRPERGAPVLIQDSSGEYRPMTNRERVTAAFGRATAAANMPQATSEDLDALFRPAVDAPPADHGFDRARYEREQRMRAAAGEAASIAVREAERIFHEREIREAQAARELAARRREIEEAERARQIEDAETRELRELESELRSTRGQPVRPINVGGVDAAAARQFAADLKPRRIRTPKK